MRVPNPIRSIFLAGTLALASAPGCGGEPSPVSEAPDTLGDQEQALACENLVPVMTGPTTPSGSVTRSGVFSTSYEAWQAFDASGSLWLSLENQTPAWLGYQWFNGAKTVNRYAINYANGSITSRAPRNWTFEGWNGSSWVVLDTRTNQVNWAGHERREYTVATPGAYTRYRVHITDDNDTRSGIVVISIGRLELLHCVTAPYSATQSVWTRTTGSPAGFTRVHDMAGDPAGRTYITGMTQLGLDGAQAVGGMDAFLQARDWNGAKLWSVQIGAPNGAAWGYGIAQNRTWEEIYVAGIVSGSIDGTPTTGFGEAFLTKYRYTGLRQWTRQLGNAGSDTEGFGVAVDAADNAFLGGTVEGALDGNPAIGTSDAFVTKYDAAGNKLWTRKVGAAGTRTHGRRVAADGAGNVFLAGWTAGGLDGNVRMGPEDFFVVKYDGAGNKQWTRQLGTPASDTSLYGAATDAAGNIYLAGSSTGGLDGNPNPTAGGDAYVTKYNGAGVKQWTRELGSSGGAWGTGLFIDASGVYLTGGGTGDIGNTTSTTVAAIHNFVARYDTAGNRQWVVQQDAARLNMANAGVYSNGVSVDAAGNLYVGGFTDGHFDGNTLMGSPDGFVTKLPKP
ncbi:SBBP repeat-containing protein [Pyxidicoccus xibeiensis]|uniref:SBBP repeat-containing protein n=1 Tax=Pyxidicoccus xibeiensis TaxID=2906759 RepID=UPI0020A82983|nr:SBBP repeat-containing protein [Pyxidicoccus xibeiensis]MCP3141818.1 SBBP repeat-containing protein [Pyxidicoccus xibeiensis]